MNCRITFCWIFGEFAALLSFCGLNSFWTFLTTGYYEYTYEYILEMVQVG